MSEISINDIGYSEKELKKNWAAAFAHRLVECEKSERSSAVSAAIANCKGYTDAELAEEKSERSSAVSAAIANCKGYTDAELAEAMSECDSAISQSAENILSNLPNIKKNPDATDGDIIDTHITVGYRKGDAGISSAVFGGTEDYPNEASGNCCFVFGGQNNAATNKNAVVIGGSDNIADYSNSLILNGKSNIVHGNFSVAINGNGNNVSGNMAMSLNGHFNNVLAFQVKSGHYATDCVAGKSSGTYGDAFIIGNGTADDARSNAFRVAYDGSVYGMAAFNSTGADYAEYFEWTDGNPDNEDRRGQFVTLEGDKIKIADTGDEIIGVISATPSVIGNAYDDHWQGMYLTDVFGQPLTHVVHHDAEYMDVEVPDIDENGKNLQTTHTETICVIEAHDAEEYIINPEYDPNQEYIPRSRRNEWATVGMLGQLIVTDDGSCVAGGYCVSSDNGIATASDAGYRVLKRLDNSHVKILFM